MPSKRDYYDVLGVDKSAGLAEIKKAYRKLALQWHPHKNSAPEANNKFKEINEAYEILTDSEKRSAYDQFGHSAFSPGGGFGEQGPFGQTYQQGPFTYTYSTYGGQPGQGFEGFGDFSDPFEIFEQFFGGASPFRSSRRAQIYRYGLTLSFMEAARGCEKEVEVPHIGHKTIKIPAGVDDGSQIRFSDFYITIDVKSDKLFRRDGADVFVDQEIPLTMAILGGTIEVPTIDGEVKLKIRSGTQSGTLVRLRSRGIKKLHSNSRGDEYVRLLVKIPSKLTPRQKELIGEFEEN